MKSMKKSTFMVRKDNRFMKILSGFILITVFIFPQLSCLHRKGNSSGKDDGLKIFILWDMEGTSGLFDKQRTWYWDEGIPKEMGVEGCELLTADVNAAANAAFEAGVDTLIICDTHHGGNNIIVEKLISDPRIKFLPRSVGMENGKWRWMPYLDESVDGFMVMAHHAKAGTEKAYLPHTQNLGWEDFRINGQSVGEMGIESCYAGHWNIPVIMMSGDAAACREAEQQFPGIISAEVKKAESFDRATGLEPEAARELVAVKVKEAINKLKEGGSFTIFKPTLPMTVTLRVSTREIAQRLSDRYGATMIDSLTLEGVVDQQSDVIKWLTKTGLDMPPEEKH
jgi:D-amino peptidase